MNQNFSMNLIKIKIYSSTVNQSNLDINKTFVINSAINKFNKIKLLISLFNFFKILKLFFHKATIEDVDNFLCKAI